LSAQRLPIAGGVKALAMHADWMSVVSDLRSDRAGLGKILPRLARLPVSLRWAAWLRAFAQPATRRRRAAEMVDGLWVAGIQRRCAVPPPAEAVARLLLATVGMSHGDAVRCLRLASDMDAFAYLLPERNDGTTAWIAIDLLLATSPMEAKGLANACREASLPTDIVDAAGAALWLHGLREPAAAHAAPPSSAGVLLCMPELRGFRRTAYRGWGRRIGRALRERRPKVSRGAVADAGLDLPQAMQTPAALARDVEPLLRDMVTAAIGELTTDGSWIEAAAHLADSCEQLFASAVRVLGRSDAVDDHLHRRRLLAEFLWRPEIDPAHED
jgi:hypothetical protein